MKVPFVNLIRENNSYSQELEDAVLSVVKSGQYVLGEQLSLFESQFASYTNSKYCIGVGNGLDALVLILRGLGIKKGDEVLVPSHTFIATWLAVSHVGATIVPVEADNSYNICPQQLASCITKKTKAIIPVHLYGRPADMECINSFAIKHDLFVIEDAAQAQGSSINNIKCGNLAHAAAFSFYPVKNLGAFGDAGAITTNNQVLANKIRSLRSYGSIKKYKHHYQGVNSRLDEIQAAVLCVKLKYLDSSNKAKSVIAKRYLSEISNKRLSLPQVSSNNSFIAWHQFVLRVDNQKNFISYLHTKHIDSMIHYPIPPHESEAYSSFFKASDFPITSELCKTIVSIPIYASLTQKEVGYIIESINNYE